jgi:prolyl oligopeptidase
VAAAPVVVAPPLATNSGLGQQTTPPPAVGRLPYPVARKGDTVDLYHGVRIADPYRWLEDPDSSETRAWVDAENRLTLDWLGRIPERESIRRRLTELWNYERFSIPVRRGGRYFWSRNDGLQNQSVVFVADSLSAPPRVLLDPNTLSADGTVALAGESPSDDGRYYAWGSSRSGSDWVEWRVRDVATGQDLPDLLQWSKFSDAAWTRDSKGFFYSRYDAPKSDSASGALVAVNSFHKLYYHRLGTPQADDPLVYHRPDDERLYVGAEVTDDGSWLVVNVRKGTDPNNVLLVKNLDDPKGELRPLAGSVSAHYDLLGCVGPDFWVKTDEGAPRGRIVRISVEKPAKESWTPVVPESADTLASATILGGNRIVATYLKDATSRVLLFDLAGARLGELPLPALGTVAGFGGKQNDPETFYSFTSYTSPTTIYRYDVAAGTTALFRGPKVGFDPALYETSVQFVTSRDGTKLPLFLSYRKGLVLDGRNPTCLYGYGGFNYALTPRFGVAPLVWMEMGGIWAVAATRGGSEYGEEWHLAGTKLRKQNVFDDFVASAEWLVANRYTSRERLAISGASNGGLLVGAVVTQRPDLVAAALPAVGVMDMLRFHKFTVGWGWISDYGSSDDLQEFRALQAYSPLHNIRPGTRYPALFATTADHDDRVVPAHSYKFVAAMQEAQGGPAPVLIRIETKAGHGGGKPVSKRIDEAADEWAFLFETLGMRR